MAPMGAQGRALGGGRLARSPTPSSGRRSRTCAYASSRGRRSEAAGAVRDPEQATVSSSSFADANFPLDAEGRTYHVGTRPGEVANRILSVGPEGRARMLASMMDGGGPAFEHASSRGFVTLTGTFEGVPVSVVATGMGTAMIDFVVRECRAVVAGDMAFLRLGTCGVVDEATPIGTVCVASEGSVLVRREPDMFGVEGGCSGPPYSVSRPVPADPQLAGLLVRCLEEELGAGGVAEGMNATADGFYASQGRVGSDFADDNEALVDLVLAAQPTVRTLEMETFALLELARASNPQRPVVACAAAIGLAQRRSNDFLTKEALEALERKAGRGAMRALAQRPLASDKETKPYECAWRAAGAR